MTDSARELLRDCLNALQHDHGCAAEFDCHKECGCGYMKLCLRITALLSENADGWMPIESAPKDNNRMLYLARIVDGELQELDFGGIWQSELESWEMPEVYYYWASAGGIEEPTHWAYQDKPLPPLPAPPTEKGK